MQTTYNFPSVWETFRPGEFPLTLCGQEFFRQIPSIFSVAGRPSIKFHQLYMWPGNLPLTFASFPCGREIL